MFLEPLVPTVAAAKNDCKSDLIYKSSSFNLINCHLKMLIKEVRSYRHFQRIEGIFEGVIRVEFVYFLEQLIDADLLGIADYEEFDARDRLRAKEFEGVRLQLLDARRLEKQLIIVNQLRVTIVHASYRY